MEGSEYHGKRSPGSGGDLTRSLESFFFEELLEELGGGDLRLDEEAFGEAC
jgi:hypothetical protein